MNARVRVATQPATQQTDKRVSEEKRQPGSLKQSGARVQSDNRGFFGGTDQKRLPDAQQPMGGQPNLAKQGTNREVSSPNVNPFDTEVSEQRFQSSKTRDFELPSASQHSSTRQTNS